MAGAIVKIGMQDVPDDLKRILGQGEEVQLYIRQKIYHPKVNVDSVAITNTRIILRHPHTLGLRKDYTDYNFQDIANVVLEKGIMRSTVKFTLRFGGEPLALNDLPNSEAERAYGVVRQNLSRVQAPLQAVFSAAPTFQPSQGAKCSKCGTAVAVGQKFCGNCGAPV